MSASFCTGLRLHCLGSAALLGAALFGRSQTIIDLQPRFGPASTTVTIVGSGFGNSEGTVTFGGAPAAAVEDWTDTRIVVRPFDLKALVNATLDVVVIPVDLDRQSNAVAFLETMPPITPSAGPAGTTIRISGKGFGRSKGAKTAISFNGQPADISAVKDWSETGMSIAVPDAGARMDVYLKVTVIGSDGRSHDIGEFKETARGVPDQVGDLTLSPSSGYGGTLVKITGKGFGDKQYASLLKFDGAILPIEPSRWKDGEIAVTLPPFDPPPEEKLVDVVIEDGSHRVIFKTGFTKLPAKATINPAKAVAGDAVTVSGTDLPDFAKEKNAKVLFNDTEATVRPKSPTDSTPDSGPNAVKVSVPDLGAMTFATVKVTKTIDGQQTIVAQSEKNAFKQKAEMWGDDDENPLDAKFVAGYEQGYLSSQTSNGNAFLAIYGRRLFGAHPHSIGPYFAIRLLTSPQTGDNYNVTSVFTNPAGQIKTTDFNTVGSAVDFTGGMEWQFKKFGPGRVTLSTIFGYGFITPTNANAIGQSYVMPHYGTVECSSLQSRLITAGFFDQNGNGLRNYSNIVANTSPTNAACFSNKAVLDKDNKPTAIANLDYAAPDSFNFFTRYGGGLRLINRWPGKTGGPMHCTSDAPCERGYVDLLFGQNSALTGGKQQHLVMSVDSTYPLAIPGLNYIYLFGTFAKRIGTLPSHLDPLILKSGAPNGGSGSTVPDPAILVIPLAQPDRDFYRFGAGVDVAKVFTALGGQAKKQ